MDDLMMLRVAEVCHDHNNVNHTELEEMNFADLSSNKTLKFETIDLLNEEVTTPASSKLQMVTQSSQSNCFKDETKQSLTKTPNNKSNSKGSQSHEHIQMIDQDSVNVH